MDITEINRAIEELENGKTSFAACSKLADLYMVRDGIVGRYNPNPLNADYYSEYSRASEPKTTEIGTYGDSDFLKAVSGKDSRAVWRIVDDFMENLRVINARAYESVLRKIKNL